jgi:DNA-binding MurR/RpiR family transcriptional regulator
VGTLCGVDVDDRIARAGASLTPAERRVAEIVLAQPQLVAFGTVADLAAAAGSGAATVVRLASKLEYDGFTGLQAAVQRSLAAQLRPAAERIREPQAGSVGRHLELELANVRATLGAADTGAIDDTVERLATARSLLVLSGDASTGVAAQMVGELQALRDGVGLLAGNEVAVRRTVAQTGHGDVLLVIDLRRYDRWVLDAATTAHRQGVWCAAVTDSVLAPLATVADRTFTVSAAGGGPFDSHVGTLSLCNVLVAGVADRLREVATERLDRTEAAWREAGSLTDR